MLAVDFLGFDFGTKREGPKEKVPFFIQSATSSLSNKVAWDILGKKFHMLELHFSPWSLENAWTARFGDNKNVYEHNSMALIYVQSFIEKPFTILKVDFGSERLEAVWELFLKENVRCIPTLGPNRTGLLEYTYLLHHKYI